MALGYAYPTYGVDLTTEMLRECCGIAVRLLRETGFRVPHDEFLSHIRGKDLLPMTMAAALASPVGAGARSLVFDREKGSNMLMQLLVGVAAPFFALLVQLSNPRSREKRADDWAVRMTKKKEALADALEKLELAAGREPLVANPATGPLFAVNPFRSGWLVAMFSTHPSTEERVARVKKAPAAGG